jgi:cytochrome P450 enzyme
MTPRAVERLRPMMQRRVNVILDSLVGRGTFDAYLDFAARLPTQVMLDLLALPDSDEMTMRHWSESLLRFSIPAGPSRQGRDGAGETP